MTEVGTCEIRLVKGGLHDIFSFCLLETSAVAGKRCRHASRFPVLVAWLMSCPTHSTLEAPESHRKPLCENEQKCIGVQLDEYN